MMRLNYWNDSWPLSEEECPCDIHFVEYLAKEKIRNKVIFHFGTGEHHIIGTKNVERGAAERNEILAVTASPQEYDAYMRMSIDCAEMAKYYKAMFVDIYTLTDRIIPNFDIVTLFHLCEFYDPEKSNYTPLNDSTLLNLFLKKLSLGGRILFYSGSSHFELAERIIKDYADRGEIRKVDQYKSLLVFESAK